MRSTASLLLVLLAALSKGEASIVIGTVVDVNRMETLVQDFEGGWGEWREENMQLLDLTNTSDGRVSCDHYTVIKPC